MQISGHHEEPEIIQLVVLLSQEDMQWPSPTHENTWHSENEQPQRWLVEH